MIRWNELFRALMCCLFAGMVLLMSQPVSADSEDPWANDPHILAWKQGRSFMFSAPQPIPESGLSFTHETATWTLEAGTVRFMVPDADGVVRAAWFEGSGTFTMEIPDPFEQKQYERFSATHYDAKVTLAFTRLLIRIPDDVGRYISHPEVSSEAGEECREARKREETWLKEAADDSWARIIAGTAIEGDDYLRIDFDTKEHEWFRYEFDALEEEEVTLTNLQARRHDPETWVSLDRADQRQPDGSPSYRNQRQIDIDRIDAEIDITKESSKTKKGYGRTQPRIGEFSLQLSGRTSVPGCGAFIFRLDPRAEMKEIQDEQGTPLPFIRMHIGKEFLSLNSEFSDDNFVVFLPKPLPVDSEFFMTFNYSLEMIDYAAGGTWYPLPVGSIEDRHLAIIVAVIPPDVEFRAMGSFLGESSVEGKRVVTWNIERPTKMIGFSFGKGFREETIETPKCPKVIVFGEEVGATTGNMVKNVAIDIASALHFYQWLFAMPLDSDHIYASRITSGHGQAFDNFIHLSEYTFLSESPGASELFRAHETAHQYWGHLVGWKSYRDQWLSESFAEYSALCYLKATPELKKYADEIVTCYSEGLTGSIKSGFSKFSRPWFARISKNERERLGPIAAGYRASTAEIPWGYFMMSYNKGCLVLNMLNWVMTVSSGKPDTFAVLIRDFLNTYKGKAVSAEDFITFLNKRTGQDWRWFFNQWIFETAIPTYSWSSDINRAADGDGWEVTVKVIQSDVPETFIMPVPLRISFGGDVQRDFVIVVDQPEKSLTVKLQEKPKKVELNPDNLILAKTKKL